MLTIPLQEHLPTKGDYSYSEFLDDLYGFMIDSFEVTNSYFFLPTELIEETDVRRMLDYGVSQGVLFVGVFEHSTFSYVEITNNTVCTHLVKLYARDVFSAMGEGDFDALREELNASYISGITTFISALDNYIGVANVGIFDYDGDLHDAISEGLVKIPLGICNLNDYSSTSYKGITFSCYNISLIQAFRFLSKTGYRFFNVDYRLVQTLVRGKSGYHKLGKLGEISADYSSLIMSGVVIK